jgi:glucose-6-phosphate isomerase
MFNGEKINTTENREVLHIALRNRDKNRKVIINNNNSSKDVMEDVYGVLEKMKVFVNKVRNKEWK